MKKLTRNFECPYLANGCCEFNQICCVAYPTWWTVIMQKWCALEKELWNYALVKKLFSFFLSIYSQCGAPAFLATRHTTMCLDIFRYRRPPLFQYCPFYFFDPLKFLILVLIVMLCLLFVAQYTSSVILYCSVVK